MTINYPAVLLLLSGIFQIATGIYLISYQRKRKASTANFLYTLTHDSLSNPIQSASTAVQNIERNIVTGKTQELSANHRSIHDLKIALNGLSRTAHNLRQLALLEVDQRSTVSERINVVSVAQHLVLEMGKVAENSGVKLLYEGHDQKITVLQQPEFVHNILKNITHNAIKYCAGRRDALVVISVSSTTKAAVIVISDNGVGIPTEQLHTLTKSPQKPMARNIASAGSGLGLYLVARLVDQCRGILDVQSEPDKGTTVSITLPKLNAAE